MNRLTLVPAGALLIVFMPLVLGGLGSGNTGPSQTISAKFDLIARLVRDVGAPLGTTLVGAALVIGARNQGAE